MMSCDGVATPGVKDERWWRERREVEVLMYRRTVAHLNHLDQDLVVAPRHQQNWRRFVF